MANTTNYNWETPDDTDLVKDGAAAIRTLGSSVDTTTKALNPSTTLGDIEYRSATANTNTRLGIGTTGQVLTVAGGVPTWATSDDANAIQNALLTTTGDTIYASGASTPARLGIGSTGQILTVAGGVPTWATPAASGSLPTFSAYDTASQSLTANTATKITYTIENWDEGSCYASSRFTPTTAGYYQVSAMFDIQPTSSSNIWIKIYKNGAAWASLDERYAITGEHVPSGSTTVYLNGTTDYIEIYGYSSQSATVYKGQTYAWFTAVGIRS